MFRILFLYYFCYCCLDYIGKSKTHIFCDSNMGCLIFIGFRSRVVGGADSINYVRFFTGEQNFYNINDTRDLEPLLMAYNAVLRVLLFNNGTLYLFVTTFIGLFLYIRW